jgi:Family of unknown function (DUF6134)
VPLPSLPGLQRLLIFCLLIAGAGPLQAEPQQWSFRVFLDDKPIGTHVFTLRVQETVRELRSEANFSVTFLGLTLYRYEHLAVERWQGDCLLSLEARTNDDGVRKNVQARLEGASLIVDANGRQEQLPGCLKTFAYWNPALLAADRLLNAQTGRLEKVSIQAQGPDQITNAKGRPSQANRFQISGPEQPITLWYDAASRWVGLESTVGSGRRLTYRLE